jgi:NMD protein affecting ribosome stability and mRNA decay
VRRTRELSSHRGAQVKFCDGCTEVEIRKVKIGEKGTATAEEASDEAAEKQLDEILVAAAFTRKRQWPSSA